MPKSKSRNTKRKKADRRKIQELKKELSRISTSRQQESSVDVDLTQVTPDPSSSLEESQQTQPAIDLTLGSTSTNPSSESVQITKVISAPEPNQSQSTISSDLQEISKMSTPAKIEKSSPKGNSTPASAPTIERFPRSIYGSSYILVNHSCFHPSHLWINGRI